MNLEELQQKYLNVPQELKNLKRWVCYRLENRSEGGKERTTKVPINAITGEFAKSNDKSTWTSFDVAIKGVAKYGCSGLGLELGDGIFGVDLDNHADINTGEKPLSKEDFSSLTKEFTESLDTYSEYSQSGEGVHVICYGTLPQGRNRKNGGNVEMYERGRYFAFTGNAIKNKPLKDCTKEIIPLWEKYVKEDNSEKPQPIQSRPDSNYLYDFSSSEFFDEPRVVTGKALSDQEVIDKASESKNGGDFISLLNGDMSYYHNDHSSADMAFCSMLAFWTNGDVSQIDRIFRSSKLMRPKWDEMRGKDTYGNITIMNAVKGTSEGYVPTERISFVPSSQSAQILKPESIEKIKEEQSDAKSILNFMNIDEKGNPIFRIKTILKEYEYNDTGNAERFYDYFGDVFHYNKDDKCFMFWTGKTWIRDSKDIIVKYANKLIEIMKQEVIQMSSDIDGMPASDEETKKLVSRMEACAKNVARVSNKSGKDAMISELQSIHDIPVTNNDFDKDIYLLNTDSGIVDLRTGKIQSFDKELMLSKSTKTAVSFEEPETWIKFLNDIFDRTPEVKDEEKSKEQTKEIIECFQQCLGYSLTGTTREQVMFLLYGSGSNGKSTFTEEISNVLGDYGKSIDVSLLMSQQNTNTSIQFSLAELIGSRFLVAKESDEGQKLAEGTVKSLTGSDQINAQQKYGRPFQFLPQFKIWLMTNNLPIIRGTDFGIWRRIFLFPFVRHFSEKEKDLDMPIKLKKESDKILGWCIKGYLKYAKAGRLVQPQCLRDSLENYKDEMDVVSKFLKRECQADKTVSTVCTDMYKAFKLWCHDNNEYPLRESKFSAEMEKKGYIIQDAGKGEPIYTGIKLFNSNYGKEYDFSSRKSDGIDIGDDND